MKISDSESAFTPPEVFHVQAGRKYRFRMISAVGPGCPIRISIDQHRLTAISADGHPTKPMVVDIVTFDPGIYR